MNKLSLIGWSLTLLLGISVPALAGPTEDLVSAVQQGKGTLAKQALLAGANPNVAIPLGEHFKTSVLVWAIKYQNLELINLALEKGASPNSTGTVDTTPQSKTALALALELKSEALIKLLLDKGATLKDDLGTMVEILVKENPPERLDWILKHHRPEADTLSMAIEKALSAGASEHLKLLIAAHPLKLVDQDTLITGLYYASMYGHAEAVKVVLPQLTWDMLDKQEYALRSFYMAANEGHEVITQLFLDKWAKDPRASAAFGEMLHGATVGGHAQIVAAVLKTIGPAGLPAKGFDEWFIRAATYNQASALKLLVDAYGKNKLTPTLLLEGMTKALDGICNDNEAQTKRCQDSWQFFLDQGVSVNATNKAGETLLLVVSQSILANQNAKWLLAKGANPNSVNKKGQNPLYFALAEQNEVLVAELKKYGAKLQSSLDDLYVTDLPTAEVLKLLQAQVGQSKPWALRSKAGKSLLSRAVKRWELDMIKQALAQGLSTTETDQLGMTPLHNLLDEDYFYPGDHTTVALEITKLLMAKGADLNTPDKTGQTLLHRVFASMNFIYIPEKGVDNSEGIRMIQELAQFLLEKGANPKLKDKKGKTPLDVAKSMSEMGYHQPEADRLQALIKKMGG